MTPAYRRHDLSDKDWALLEPHTCWDKVENAFLHIKQWRGIATRYAKRFSSFVAVAQIRCFAPWRRIS